MINNIQHTFSIHDLELLSGIKAHTIRIWEKRYSLLNPTRLNRNIRVYNILDLQKILNVSLLQRHNLKISELSKLSDGALAAKAKSISEDKFESNYHINSLIVSMFSFDDELFEEVYAAQSETISFNDIYVNTFLPLLYHIGLLWQTNGIKPAHEHFTSNLIYQKITLNIAQLPATKSEPTSANVLFLPEGEVHEIGLLYMLYKLKALGQKTIYLGRDIPTSDLHEINSQFKDIHWICAFLIDRTKEEKADFINQMEQLLKHTKNACSIIGKIWNDHSTPNDNITFYEGFDQVDLS
ncbi:MAG: methanogenic corrinoid protein MtbC1 [Bacteroidia bacterium]